MEDSGTGKSERVRSEDLGRRKATNMSGHRCGTVSERQYALLRFMLVPADHPEAGYRFLVFTRKARKHSYEAAVVEKSDEHGASNYFIRRVPVSRFFSKKSEKRLQVHATDAILMVDAAEKEYEADIYFWSKGSYPQEPVDY